MTADEIEWRTYASETDTNRVESYSETHDYLDRRQQQSGSESIEDPLEILDHLWKSGTTPDSSIDAMATGKHMPIDTSEHRRRMLLDRLISLGLVEEFRPVWRDHGRIVSCGQMIAPDRRYRLSKTAVELYETEE